jgi:hypothetical protein
MQLGPIHLGAVAIVVLVVVVYFVFLKDRL